MTFSPKTLIFALGALCCSSVPLHSEQRADELVTESLPSLPSEAIAWPLLEKAFARQFYRLKDSDTSEDAALQIAYLCHANGYEASALAWYEWLAARSEDGEDRARLYYCLADLVKEKGELEAARDYLERAAGEYAGYAPLQSLLGEARFKSNELAGAEQCFRRALEIETNYPPALLGLARIYESQGKSERAIAELERLLASEENNYNAQSLLARNLERSGEDEKAFAIRSKITHSSQAPRADPWLAPIREAVYDPQRLDFLFLDHFMVGEVEAALPYLERLEQVEPGKSQGHRYRGLYYMELGQFERAVVSFRDGIEAGGDPSVFYPLGIRSLQALERMDEAESLAREGLLQSPDNAAILLELGRLLFEQQRLEEALSVSMKAVERNPYDVDGQLLFARAALWSKKLEAAQASLDQVYQLALSDPEALARAALVYLEAGRFEDALPFLEQARSVAPFYAEALELLADAHFELGKKAWARGDALAALESLERALEFRQGDLNTLSAQAQLLLELQRFAEAEPALRQLIEATGGSASLWLAFGDTLARNGKPSEARQAWENALRLIGSASDSGAERTRPLAAIGQSRPARRRQSCDGLAGVPGSGSLGSRLRKGSREAVPDFAHRRRKEPR